MPSSPPPRSSLPGVVALSAFVGLVAAVWSLYTIELLPPGLHARQVQISAAATQVVLDAPRSWILDQEAREADFQSLATRAGLLGSLVTSEPARALIARRLGVPADQIAGVSRTTADVTALISEPDSEQRANQLLIAARPYRLDVQADPARPLLNIYAQAPTPAGAERLANAAVDSLGELLATRAAERRIAPKNQVQPEQLGRARGGVVNGGTRPQIALLTFLVAFGLCAAMLLVAPNVRRGWKRAAAPARDPGRVLRLDATHRRVTSAAARGGDWPRTTRVLPWMIAGFMAVLWLVPFNTTELTASLPFDLKFDRLILPLVVGSWIVAVAVGGLGAPRIRWTPIHTGIAGFLAVACVGVVLNAHALNRSLEFDLASKKLTLLVSYVVLFVLVASGVRRTEVKAYFKYSLLLAVACALGTIYEYRFHYNVFYEGTSALLPGIFQVGAAESGGVDDLGRVLTRGPAEHPLETVAMLSMALPIALVWLMHAKQRRDRILYGLAACILLAAAISTYRKSALIAPASVGLSLAYFRRRELLKLAPLALVSLVVIHLLSPGAFGSIAFQLQGNRLGVGTVSDRAADYDAVRPDVWTHLLFGRGFGSYDHVSYRILDSEILGRLVDTGVLGLGAFVLMVVSIILSARRLIRSRDPRWGPPALAVAAAAVAFLVVSFLFDVTSFPHTPYILFSLAGLLAVILARPEDPPLAGLHAVGRPRARRGAAPPVRRPAASAESSRPTHHSGDAV